jgi:hypothetical protein
VQVQVQEYERHISITNRDPVTSVELWVVRLPTYWQAYIYGGGVRSSSFSQYGTELNGGHEHLNDDDFLDRVRIVASLIKGIDFDFE